MTIQNYGTFGFLNPGQLPDEPLLLLDFGIEKDRQNPMISTIMTGTTTAIFFSIPFREGVFLKGTASPALCCPAPLSSR